MSEYKNKYNGIENTELFLKTAFPIILSKNQHTQLGVHFEEISEMVDTITGKDAKTIFLLDMVSKANKALALFLKENDNVIEIKPENRVEFLDGLCDQIVTATGVAYMNGMDIVNGLAEVNRSNFSKFDENGNPILDENLKMVKGPHYSKPNLKPFV